MAGEMTIVVRKMEERDAGLFLEVHHAAVRGTAAKDYSPRVIAAWASLPITPARIADVVANPDREVRLIAELDGTIVGIGAVVLASSELRACYVLPVAGRKGVGTALVRALEDIARCAGLTELNLDSSTTAEPFYAARGYSVIERGEHVLRSGDRMACVKMRKVLAL